jgi:hypothetical protein
LKTHIGSASLSRSFGSLSTLLSPRLQRWFRSDCGWPRLSSGSGQSSQLATLPSPRFSSQWGYLANLYNQIVATPISSPPSVRSEAATVLVACNQDFGSASGVGHGARQRVPLGWGRVSVSRPKAAKRRDSSSPVRERWVAVKMRSSAEGAKDAADFRPFRAAGEGRSNPALTHWARRVSPLRGLARSVLSGAHPRGTAFSHSREMSFFESFALAKQWLQATSLVDSRFHRGCGRPSFVHP